MVLFIFEYFTKRSLGSVLKFDFRQSWEFKTGRSSRKKFVKKAALKTGGVHGYFVCHQHILREAVPHSYKPVQTVMRAQEKV